MIFGLMRHIFLCVFGMLFLFPFVWMILTSFKPENEIFSLDFSFFPSEFGLVENYTKAFSEIPLMRFLWNGFVVSVGILVIQILVAYPCAYALSKHKFLGRKLFLSIVVCCLLIPTQVICVPLYVLIHSLDLLDTYVSLILPFTISVFGIFIIRQFINTIPNDLIYAAKMDGFSEFSIVWKIILPLTTPALISFGIFSIVAHWNDYFWPLIVVSSPELFTPTLGVAAFKNNEAGSHYGALMAAACVVVIPLLVLFLLLQKKFMQGIATTGIK